MNRHDRPLARLRRAWASLPAEEAEVLALHASGVELAALAVELGIDVAGVERRLAAALVSFDRALGEGGAFP
ncbi:hypothetical protein [Sphingomonas sp. KC8]|uniref:hypothetical protein n=1 Tax=Sphingomonas sp. KC8 TaxID=1030157 RepID=UPI000248AED5|nr:hypothetical protein [Sphingomonas sp. KC8]ARS26816.1 hypothetical protein KC8_05890 [Sphingomonas sp. KC8]